MQKKTIKKNKAFAELLSARKITAYKLSGLLGFKDKTTAYKWVYVSPGMEMRFKALHEFTSKLPKIQASGETPPYGNSTETAIRSGVIRGIEHEISGYIQHLKKNYPSLLVFLTGGNEFSFDTNLKSGIFADGFLVLKGLNRILEYNDVI